MNETIRIEDIFNEGMAEFAAHRYDRSVELLSRVIEHDPAHRLARSARGAAHLKMDNDEAAIADFDRIIAVDPDSARAHHLRGLAREKQGDHSGALADFDRAIELNPEYGAAYYSRTTLHSNLGNVASAAADAEMIAHLTNRNIETFANDNNVWRSQQMRLESAFESELNR